MKKQMKNLHFPFWKVPTIACLIAFICSLSLDAVAKNRDDGFPSIKNFAGITVSGKVTDTKNSPLDGVSVLIKGTKKGVNTNAQGAFTLTNVPENAILVFSFTGYGAQEYQIKGSAPINISLVEQTSGLNEVVVVGYGTRTKKDLTGAVSQVKATQLENENPKSVQDMLRGNAPGLDVGFDATTKGSNSSLQIRGKGTLTASSSPLIVLDGVIYPGGLEDINPNDISTIDILKDASSAAVYGARSANGVILITTKRGKMGKPIITVNSNVGRNKVENKPHLLNATEFLPWRQDVKWAMAGFDSTSKPGVQYKYWNPTSLPSSLTVADWLALDGSAGDPNVAWLNRLGLKPVEITNYQNGSIIDWDKLIYNQNAMQQDHTISVAQRKEDLNYYFSLGYLENQGLTVGDKYKTIRTRFSLESNIAKYLTVGTNIQFSERDESSVLVSLSDMIHTTPYGSYFAADGVTLRASPNDDPGNNSHPFLGQTYSDRMYKYDNLFGQIYAKGKLPYGFSYSVTFSPRFDVLREYNHQSANNPTLATRKGIVDRRNQSVYSWNLDNQINWAQKFGKHSVEATFLVNAEKFQSWNTNIHAENFAPNDNLSFNSIQSATLPFIASSDDQYETGDALMGRVNYNYNQRYYLTVTARRDGYSAFGQQNPRATFPSAAVSWILTDESFMKSTSKWLDYAKVRLSYGENGNRSIGRYAALSNLSSGTYTYVTGGGAAYNVGYVSASNLSNPALKWERNSSVNLGVDYAILKGIVSGSIDYYTRTTKDLLVNRTLPSVTGFNNILANLGEVQNNGMEFSINTQNMKHKNFEWRTTIAFWWNKNKIVHLYGKTPDYDAQGAQTGTSEKDDIGNGWFIGKNINSVYDYTITGVWQSADAALAKTYGYKPGDFRLQDTNGDGKYTIADKEFQGTTTPDFSWNLRNEFKLYKNFDFSFTLYAKMGQLSQYNESKNVDNFYDRSQYYQRPYWTPTNPINDFAALMSNAGGPVSWNVYRKSTFIRLSNISLAYNVPTELAHKWKLEGLKAYVNIVNSAVFSPWKFFDPEYHGAGSSTLPNNQTPVPITFNFGINLTL
ncbi:MAG: SusC/RagA family TonB-linked outer membrane protein [Bacteroidetes bacterium]|nr:SusC/RagA family TonB-linked outer membrane protein [Bacteroidota bacterium]